VGAIHGAHGPANPPTPTPDRLFALLLKAQGNGASQLPRCTA